MAANTLMNKVQGMGNQKADFFSKQNAFNFWNDLKGGAQPGLAGGAVAGVAQAAYGALNPPPRQVLAGSPAAQSGIAAGTQLSPEFSAQLNNVQPHGSQFPGFLQAARQNVGQIGQAGNFLAGLNAQPNQPDREQQVAQALPTTPQAQTGPSMFNNAGSSSGNKGYFSFDKYFGQSVENRPLIEQNNNMIGQSRQTQDIAGPTQGPGQIAQEEVYGRPESGIKGYLYDIGKFLHESEVAQGIGGFLGGLGGGALAGYFTGGLGAGVGFTAGSAAGGGLVRGLGGQLQNFFSTKQTPQANAQMNQPQILQVA